MIEEFLQSPLPPRRPGLCRDYMLSITTVRLNGSLGFCKRAMERVFGGEGAVSI